PVSPRSAREAKDFETPARWATEMMVGRDARVVYWVVVLTGVVPVRVLRPRCAGLDSRLRGRARGSPGHSDRLVLRSRVPSNAGADTVRRRVAGSALQQQRPRC